ncbi:MAG TPA: NUDIX hydrolase [Caulobacteraceae bacterium]|jgi:8-oxo-dGTP pyrophosphatase MutT (NUDIX family)
MTEQAFKTPTSNPHPDTPRMPPRTGKAVRPRDAATLIVIRRDGPKPRVLMGRRHGGHDFMPDKWVFPGGRIDPSDFRAPVATELRPEVAEHLYRTAPARRARALALSAIRETFEETGLLLATKAEHRPIAGPWRTFVEQGALADLAAMDYIARAVTPPMVPKRYDARFFMADAERLISLERQADCGELTEIAWVELSEALGLDLPAVTAMVLKEIPHRFADPERKPPYWRAKRGVRGMVSV